jgi:hypothetical protein
MSAIDHFLEGLDADTPYRVDEALGLGFAVREITFDQALDRRADRSVAKSRANYFPKTCSGPLTAAD